MKPVWSSNLRSHCSLHRPITHSALSLGIVGGFHTRHYSTKPPSQSASQKLFADAEREEAEAAFQPTKPSRLTQLGDEHENWTGDESVKDSVLRMLVDKYKPLRYGTIQTAEEKLKQSPPQVSSATSVGSPVPLKPSSASWADEQLLPPSAEHRPWHTQFKAPDHHLGMVKLAQMPPPVSTKRRSVNPEDEHIKKKEKDARKRSQQAGRLTQARESTLDYQLGIKGASAAARPKPQNMKGWTNLIEDKIETARRAGLFSAVRGRGQPLTRSTAEHNPFIAREEFLMNRIVQRNGAAPPWVELQGELDTAVNTFRELLRQSWIRRAVRMLTTLHPSGILERLTLHDVEAFRDPEWLKREDKYHNVALEEVNSLVRKYNGLAPYPVRRPYYMLNVETDKLYKSCAEDILRSIAELDREVHNLGGGKAGTGVTSNRTMSSGSDQVAGPTTLSSDASWRLGDLIRAMHDKITEWWKVW